MLRGAPGAQTLRSRVPPSPVSAGEQQTRGAGSGVLGPESRFYGFIGTLHEWKEGTGFPGSRRQTLQCWRDTLGLPPFPPQKF